MQHVVFYDSLLSLSVRSSQFIRVVAGVSIPFPFTAEEHSMAQIPHIRFLRLSVDGTRVLCPLFGQL